jgi:transmembrane sensor
MTLKRAPVADLCLQRAVRAWTRRTSGEWSSEEEADLQAWLAAAPEHRAAYQKVAELWAHSGALKGRIPRTKILSPGYRVLRASAAAVLVAAFALGIWHYLHVWWDGTPVHWVAGREPRSIALADGSQVMLDAGSEIVIQLGSAARRVTLTRGEALFSVVHDPWRPFVVETGHGRVVDIGTRFDVERLPDSARVAVLEGRVGIATAHGEMQLSAGQSGGYDNAGTLLPVREAADSSAELWATGLRRFRDAPLVDVAARLERYHPVRFTFAEPRLQQLRLSGTFRITDLPLFLRTLCAALPVEAHWINPHLVQFTSSTADPDPAPPLQTLSGSSP